MHTFTFGGDQTFTFGGAFTTKSHLTLADYHPAGWCTLPRSVLPDQFALQMIRTSYREDAILFIMPCDEIFLSALWPSPSLSLSRELVKLWKATHKLLCLAEAASLRIRASMIATTSRLVQA
jgi:hypothetical protein